MKQTFPNGVLRGSLMMPSPVQMNDGKEIPFWMKTLSGMSSGAIAVTIGTPMDVALVRMQSDSMKPKEQRRNYRHVIDALRRVAAEEGLGSLYAVSEMRLALHQAWVDCWVGRGRLRVLGLGEGCEFGFPAMQGSP